MLREICFCFFNLDSFQVQALMSGGSASQSTRLFHPSCRTKGMPALRLRAGERIYGKYSQNLQESKQSRVVTSL